MLLEKWKYTNSPDIKYSKCSEGLHLQQICNHFPIKYQIPGKWLTISVLFCFVLFSWKKAEIEDEWDKTASELFWSVGSSSNTLPSGVNPLPWSHFLTNTALKFSPALQIGAGSDSRQHWACFNDHLWTGNSAVSDRNTLLKRDPLTSELLANVTTRRTSRIQIDSLLARNL